MLSVHRLAMLLGLAVLASCTGCGGGGGGSSSGGGGGGGSTPLSLTATAPSLTGQTGNDSYIEVRATGTGTVNTATADIVVNEATFGPVTGVTVAGSSRPVAGLADGVAACYKWIDSRTIRVYYVSASGAASGTVIAQVPVKIKSETANTATLSNISLNQ